jgi:hypothetical protein
VSSQYGRRDETCPVSTGGGTRRVQSVREGGGRGTVDLHHHVPHRDLRTKREGAREGATWPAAACPDCTGGGTRRVRIVRGARNLPSGGGAHPREDLLHRERACSGQVDTMPQVNFMYAAAARALVR